MKVLFLGYGRMGAALGESWARAGLVDSIVAVDPGLPASHLARVHGSIDTIADEAFDLLVLAVKPAMAAAVLGQLSPRNLANALLLSVAAGVTCATLSQAVAGQCPVIRTMPNTAVMVNAGCTGLYSHDPLPGATRARLGQLFQAVGEAFWVDEEIQLDAVTAISGSGPAYYHLFTEALADAALGLGLSPELGKRLAAQTALGAATLQAAPDADFAALRLAVTSPNGTTAAAIAVFEAQTRLRSLVDEAATAAYRRSRELSVS